MPRGGARPGAGRPKGSLNKPQTSATLPSGDECTPLSYLLAVLRDADVDVRRRDRAAELLLTFLHERRPTPAALPPRVRARRDALADERTALAAWERRAREIEAKHRKGKTQ